MLLVAAPTILPPVVFSSAFTSTRPLKVEIPLTLKLLCTIRSWKVPIPAGAFAPLAPV